MKKIFIYIILLFAVATAPFTGCEDDDKEDLYSFKVISSGDNFTGYYFADSDSPGFFTGTLMTGSTTTHIFESSFDPDESVTVQADGVSSATTSITIYLFKESKKIKTVTATPIVTGGTVSALLEYSLSDTSE